jgi:hypothetical protein
LRASGISRNGLLRLVVVRAGGQDAMTLNAECAAPHAPTLDLDQD